MQPLESPITPLTVAALRMTICKRPVPPYHHLQEAGSSGWSSARGWSLWIIICKRPTTPDDHLQEAGPSGLSLARGWPHRMTCFVLWVKINLFVLDDSKMYLLNPAILIFSKYFRSISLTSLRIAILQLRSGLVQMLKTEHICTGSGHHPPHLLSRIQATARTRPTSSTINNW